MSKQSNIFIFSNQFRFLFHIPFVRRSKNLLLFHINFIKTILYIPICCIILLYDLYPILHNLFLKHLSILVILSFLYHFFLFQFYFYIHFYLSNNFYILYLRLFPIAIFSYSVRVNFIGLLATFYLLK